MKIATRSFDHKGVRIAYDMAGAGELIIFLHGIGGNKTNWVEQLVHFSRQYCCVAWDARGYLDSGDPDRPLAFSDFADDLVALIDHLGAARAHIVGLSMGGLIGLDFVDRYPDRIATLTLAASSAGMGRMSDEERALFMQLRLLPLDAGESMAAIAQKIITVIASDYADPDTVERLRRSTAVIRAASYRQAVMAVAHTNFERVLGAITAPTLVIVGTEDKVLPVVESAHLAEHIPGSRLIVIGKAGHLCNIEAADLFNAHLLIFLNDHADTRATDVQTCRLLPPAPDDAPFPTLLTTSG